MTKTDPTVEEKAERSRALIIADSIAEDLGMKELLPERVIRRIMRAIHGAAAVQKEFDAELMDTYIPLCGRDLAKIIRDGGPDYRG